MPVQWATPITKIIWTNTVSERVFGVREGYKCEPTCDPKSHLFYMLYWHLLFIPPFYCWCAPSIQQGSDDCLILNKIAAQGRSNLLPPHLTGRRFNWQVFAWRSFTPESLGFHSCSRMKHTEIACLLFSNCICSYYVDYWLCSLNGHEDCSVMAISNTGCNQHRRRDQLDCFRFL